jgi:hypothetical protein
MIRQDEYEKAYTERRQIMFRWSLKALNLLRQLSYAEKCVGCKSGSFKHQIARRALRDELASRFARESIHDVENYDD